MSATQVLATWGYGLKQRAIEARRDLGLPAVYLIASGLVLLALLVRLVMAPVDAGLQYLTFFPAVTLTAVLCGFWPGMFATITGMLLATYFFTPPYYAISIEELQQAFWPNFVFVMDGAIVCASIEGLHLYYKKFSAEMQAAETLLHRNQALMQSSMDGIHVVDMQGNILETNDAFCRMLGYTQEEMSHLNVADLDAQWSAEVLRERLQAFAGKSGQFTTLHRRKDGTLLNVELSFSGADIGGQYLYFLSSRDVTARTQAETALQQSRANLRAMLDNSPYLCWMKDATGRYTAMNTGYASYLRLETPGQGIGKTDFDLHPQELAEKYRADDDEIMASRQQKHVEESSFNGKSTHWVETWKTPIIDAQGEVLGTVGFACDISGRKQAEQELIILNTQLAQEVSKRTSDLSRLAARIQEVAEDERSRLARELHDELGSTLAGLSMQVVRLKGKSSDPVILQGLTEIRELASQASQTTRGFISQLYPTSLNDCGVITAIKSLVDAFRKHSGIEVELAVPNVDVAMEHAFALAAYRITQECLTNIAKHAEASKVLIEASSNGESLDLVIQDNGKGLSGSGNTGGHGILGMTERARYLGGSISFGNENGKGTTVRLHLPLASPKPQTRKRVLVADDHAIVRNALRDLLDSQTDDFSVEGEATDGQAAIQMAVEGTWDVMLLDITMPKKSGLKALEEIKAAKPELPIIMLSSHSVREYGKAALVKGASGYIEKGETGKLVEAMRQAVLA